MADITEFNNEEEFDQEPDMVTIELEDGTEFDCVVLAIYDAPNGKQYIALLPLDDEGENKDGEVFLYRCGEKDGEIVMDKLKDLDEVAYVRFASVYRDFKDVSTFVAEVEKLLKGTSKK